MLLRLFSNLTQLLFFKGSYNFKLPCYLTSDSDCTYGCPWTSHSMQTIATPNVSIQSFDEFFPAAQVFPDPLPSIKNKCISSQTCTLNISTVSELIYSSKQTDDDPFQPQGAKEIRSKLKSRQAVLLAATGVKHDFSETDSGNLCGEINTASLKWAIDHTPHNVLYRYMKTGKTLSISSDINYTNAGPLWIWAPIVN